MKNKSGVRWSYKDGVAVKYSTLYPKGLTTAMIRSPPDCPIELRARIRKIREELKEARLRARILYHTKLVYERKLSEVEPFKSLSEAA